MWRCSFARSIYTLENLRKCTGYYGAGTYKCGEDDGDGDLGAVDDIRDKAHEALPGQVVAKGASATDGMINGLDGLVDEVFWATVSPTASLAPHNTHR